MRDILLRNGCVHMMYDLPHKSCTFPTQAVPSPQKLYLPHPSSTFPTKAVPSPPKQYLNHKSCIHNVLLRNNCCMPDLPF